MNLQQLEYFKVIAETKNFTEASNILSVTQPALSKAISKIEEELDVKLIQREGRNITIHNIENIKIDNPFVSMKVTCSKGTYVRSLCYDIGEKLGVYAAMTELNRAETSVFKQEDSINIKDLTSENYSQYLISIEEALNHYERININHKYAKLLVNGVRVGDTRYTNDKVENEKLYRVYDGEKFLGLGSKNNEGFKITKLLIT